MLTLNNPQNYNTLLDAEVLQATNEDMLAIIYVATGSESDVLITRRQFRAQVQTYAVALQQLGICPRDMIVIAHTQNLESIYAFWAAILVGAVPSMFPTLTEKLDPEIYMRNMAELVQLSDVRAVLTTDEFAPLLDSQVACPVYGSGQLTTAVTQNTPPFISATPEVTEIAFLQHSSGTTGLQKGVALSHQALLNQLAAYGESLQINANDVVVSWLPLYHDMGLIAGFLLPLIFGVPLVLMSPFDWVSHPALLFRAIDEHQGTLCWLPNFAYNHCARRVRQRDVEGYSLNSMRLFINCSEPVRHDSHELFVNRFAAQGARREMLGVSYAMAENTFAVTQTIPGEAVHLDTVDAVALQEQKRAVAVLAVHPHAEVKVSCGPAIAGTAVSVRDPSGKTLPERHVGELAIKSNCMLSEYYKRPDLQPFQDGCFLTGDMGYVADGEVYVIGRSKDLIINAGKNIYPQDIEAIVNDVPGVHKGRAVVFGVPDEREGTELLAVVAEVDVDDTAVHKQIKKAIRQETVRQSMVTISYVTLVGPKWLIKTSSGKIARAANRAKWLAERVS